MARSPFCVVQLLAGVIAVAVAVPAAPAALRFVGPAGPPPPLPGLQAGAAPWPAEWPHLAQRLHAIDLPALTVEGEVLHIHQHLDVRVHRRRVVVPAGIGFGVGKDTKVHFLSPVHTHATDGIIHFESPTVRSFTLGDVFDLWGVRFTETCLGGYCAKGDAQVRVYVNGRRVRDDPRAVVLASHQQILVSFGTSEELPSPIRARFAFRKGL
jgi:hypothetical protein